jgi:hypothetical protein
VPLKVNRWSGGRRKEQPAAIVTVTAKSKFKGLGGL